MSKAKQATYTNRYTPQERFQLLEALHAIAARLGAKVVFPTEEKRQQIIDAIGLEMHIKGRVATMGAVAKRLKIEPSSDLMQHLEDMTHKKCLDCDCTQWRPSGAVKTRYTYKLSEREFNNFLYRFEKRA